MNHRAKFDAASFILGGEIRNRTNTHKTVTDISTLDLSACVDNNTTQVYWLFFAFCRPATVTSPARQGCHCKNKVSFTPKLKMHLFCMATTNIIRRCCRVSMILAPRYKYQHLPTYCGLWLER